MLEKGESIMEKRIKRKVENTQELSQEDLVKLLISNFAKNNDVQGLEAFKERLLAAKEDRTQEIKIGWLLSGIGAATAIINAFGSFPEPLKLGLTTTSIWLCTFSLSQALDRIAERNAYQRNLDEINTLTYSIKQ